MTELVPGIAAGALREELQLEISELREGLAAYEGRLKLVEAEVEKIPRIETRIIETEVSILRTHRIVMELQKEMQLTVKTLQATLLGKMDQLFAKMDQLAELRTTAVLGPGVLP